MGRVVGFRGGRHREMADLLPWYLTGQLDEAERGRVQAHLKVCAECQAEVRFHEKLGPEIAALPLDVEQGWMRMRRQIEADAAVRIPARRVGGALALTWHASPMWSGWAAASAMLVAGLLWLQPLSPTGRYHALSARTAPAPGDALVIFQPQTPEGDLRAALKASGARIVGGPTEADAYVLSIPMARRAQALAALRARSDVVMAEPIDPGAQP
ncbi:MAG: zf-HC2 domain-containing protein [Phenylobacterium sp.]